MSSIRFTNCLMRGIFFVRSKRVSSEIPWYSWDRRFRYVTIPIMSCARSFFNYPVFPEQDKYFAVCARYPKVMCNGHFTSEIEHPVEKGKQYHGWCVEISFIVKILKYYGFQILQNPWNIALISEIIVPIRSSSYRISCFIDDFTLSHSSHGGSVFKIRGATSRYSRTVSTFIRWNKKRIS